VGGGQNDARGNRERDSENMEQNGVPWKGDKIEDSTFSKKGEWLSCRERKMGGGRRAQPERRRVNLCGGEGEKQNKKNDPKGAAHDAVRR